MISRARVVDPGANPGTMGAMSLAQLEYFVAVAQAGHVGRAARNLRIAQPAVSRQIRRLEEELGRCLFRRTPRGMTLSRAGEVFLGHAQAILHGIRAARDDVRRVGLLGEGLPDPGRSGD